MDRNFATAVEVSGVVLMLVGVQLMNALSIDVDFQPILIHMNEFKIVRISFLCFKS